MRAAWRVLIPLAAAACGSSGLPQPPDLRPGEQACEACAMTLSDPRLAAAVTVEDERGRRHELFFDDVGCFLVFAAGHPEPRPVARFVQDFTGGGWLAAQDAVYLRSSSIATPMGYGIAAFASRQRAEAERADRGGDVLALAELEALASGGELPREGVVR